MIVVQAQVAEITGNKDKATKKKKDHDAKLEKAQNEITALEEKLQELNKSKEETK